MSSHSSIQVAVSRLTLTAASRQLSLPGFILPCFLSPASTFCPSRSSLASIPLNNIFHSSRGLEPSPQSRCRKLLSMSQTHREPDSDSRNDNVAQKLPFSSPWLPRMKNLVSWPERFRVVFLCFLSFIICNCDRINISVAILPMAKYYGWSQTTVGVVQSAFFWGYVLTQIPGGYFADKYGGKHVLAAGVITWSAMTVLTPIAASTSTAVLLLARALLGVGEGVAMPSMNNIISKWVPEKERARSLSLTYSGMYMGSVVGLLLCPAFIVSFGWQSVFYFFGTLGFLWWILWQIFTSSTPQLSRSISDDELTYIMSGRDSNSNATGQNSNIPWRDLLTKSPTWAIIVAHFCTTWGTSSRYCF